MYPLFVIRQINIVKVCRARPYVCWVSNTVHRATSITAALYDVHTFLTRLGKSIIHV